MATEVAAVIFIIGAALGPLAAAALAPLAAALVAMAWIRLRGRWLFQWSRVWLSYRTRRRQLPAGSDSAAFLALVHPGSLVQERDLDGVPAAVIAGDGGLTALIDLGDPSILPTQLASLPSPADLLPARAPDTPRFRLQLVLAAIPARGPGAIAEAYQQLTKGRIAASERAVLAVHAPAAEEWSEADLRRALSGAVRKIKRRLDGTPGRVLGRDAALRTIVEFAHHDGAHPVRENWTGLHSGGLPHATFRLSRWPDPRTDSARDFVSRLLQLPADAITVSLTIGPWATAGTSLRTDLVVRLTGADAADIAAATDALHRLVDAARAKMHRLDGEHLDGLALTMPLGGSAPAVLPREVEPGSNRPVAMLNALGLPAGSAGLLVGPNRRHEPVTVRLLRPEPTRAMFAGGVRAAQLIVLRSMALGARVIVRTARPQAWERFMRNLGGPNDSIALATPQQALSVPTATQLRPLLMVIDVGAVGADRSTGQPWHTTLVLRDEIEAVDAEALGHADVAFLQPSNPQAAALAVSVLGLSDSQKDALSRPVPGLIGIVHKRSVRWASLGTVPVEQQLLT